MLWWDTETAMEISGAGKSPNSTLSFRYNANNEQLEEMFDVCDDDPPSPPFDPSPIVKSETESPKKAERTPSIIDKYFKSMRTDKTEKEKPDEKIDPSNKASEEIRNSPKDVQASPVKEYLKNLGKRSSEATEVKEGANETWKIFHDFKFKITQAVEDMKTRSAEGVIEPKEKSVPRENSISDSEENSIIKDSDQSVGDTDNQVSSLESSMQNLSEMTQPLTAKATELSFSADRNHSDSSDDTHKNLHESETSDAIRDAMLTDQLEVESGVEALEDGIDGLGEPNQTKDENVPDAALQTNTPPPSPLKTAFGLPPSNTHLPKPSKDTQKDPEYFFNFTMYLLTFLVVISFILFRDCSILNGFLLGLWCFCFVGNFKEWFMDKYMGEWDPSYKPNHFRLKRSSATPFTYTIPSVKEHRPLKKYEGWVNHYRYPDYDPNTYHLNKTTTAFMKLEGCDLRLSYTKTKVSKRAFWNEKLDKIEFYQHRLYNLTGARVILEPFGLVKRRTWSKKYPICILLSGKEKIQILEKESVAAERRTPDSTSSLDKKRDTFEIERESAETNTSPEKKKKFVWRRREKSISRADNDSGRESISKDQPPVSKEGLRHRLVRKMHRDKKADNVSTGTEPDAQSQVDKNMQFEEVAFHDAEMEATHSTTSTGKEDDDELDETEISRIKEFLEEAELETGAESTSAEGEWTIHVKDSQSTATRLYFFTRTGRDKHEWFRRLTLAIAEANAAATPEPSIGEEKPPNSESNSTESKDGGEIVTYKANSEREGVSLKTPVSSKDAKESSEKNANSAHTAERNKKAPENYEHTFWPYLLKIIQPKSLSPACECRMLPSEVTWLNTVIARVLFDVMRNELITARMQARVQKKLNTIKLPSFMSPLVVMELSLQGACPLIERVSAPTWDERGIWLDADLRYEGGAYITVLTQINLMKLKEKNLTLEDQLLTNLDDEKSFLSRAHLPDRKSKPAVYDSEIEDSAESSSDDEIPLVQPVDSTENLAHPTESTTSEATTSAASSKKKFLRMVDKIATNKYFQQVTDYKYVKRAMEGLSNTDIKVQVEVHGLEGRLVINLPPPPHDRVWVGFRSGPQLVLKARPAVGARSLRFAHISNWIEEKLGKEFEKALVVPNMEDIILESMTPTPVDFE